MDWSIGLRQVFSKAGMQDKGGLQIGLTEGQEFSWEQSSWVESSSVESSKELVEQDLDRTLSTYIKY